MKRSSLWLGAVFVVAAAVAISLVALPRGPEWTTSSDEALAEFDAALDAQMKLYHDEVISHLERALELDPDFVMAKLRLAGYLHYDDGDRDRSKALFDEVSTADLSKLKPRERMLASYAIAMREDRAGDAEKMLDDYLEDHPDDPFALSTKCELAWSRREFDNAERLFRRLVEIAPNFVVAYNQLGYITMMQGRFAEAEEYFTSYRFIAPDQANPHDSLGELYIIQGRYDEAVLSIERALEIYPDFWLSYRNLMLAKAMLQDFEGARAVIARLRAQDGAPQDMVRDLECSVDLIELEGRKQWRQIVDQSSDCLDELPATSYASVAVHRAAAMLGRWDVTEALETRLRERLEIAREKGSEKALGLAWPVLLHMEGARLALQGKLAEAEAGLRKADEQLVFRDAPTGLFKLYNRSMIVETLLAEGRDAEAHSLLAKIRSDNPMLVAQFEEDGLKILGLRRV